MGATLTIGMPPNGFAGAAQQTPAVRHHLSQHISATKGHTKSVKRKRKTTTTGMPKKAHKVRAAGTHKARKSKSIGATILKAGSSAALAWGKKMAAAKRKKAKGA